MNKKNSWLGPKQLAVAVFCGILFLAYTCMNTGMTNTVLPAVCEMRGWAYENILPFMSYGGYIGAFGALFFAQVVLKKGPKFVMAVSLILAAVCIVLYGTTEHYPVFVVSVIGNRVFGVAYQATGATALLTNWFPRTKGIVLGWVTMGIILSDVIWSPYIPKAVAAFGLTPVFAVVGVGFVVLALITVFAVHNFPEECGCYPDNDPTGLEDLHANKNAMKNYKSSFTIGRLFRTPQVWQIGIGWGALWMIGVAFVSQLVKRCVSIGYDAPFAIQVLQVASVIGLFGSWLFGFLDQKLGTKKATMIFCISICALFVFGLFQPLSPVLVWISACGIMGCVGGICNLQPSMVGTVFGRWDFAAANRIITPIATIMMSSSFIIVSRCIKSPFGYNALYVCCAVIAAVIFFVVLTTKDKMIGATDAEVLGK
ncbi:MAG: OFA family MFS transporter [Eubacterium sp.]|jgi:Sugar phosphate permease|nr:OFA family MFS transporter [Eubacterium sp.]